MPENTSDTDIHQHTVEHDEGFAEFMVVLHGEDWRERLTPREQRGAAKQWNFSKVYGIGPLTPDKIRRLLV